MSRDLRERSVFQSKFLKGYKFQALIGTYVHTSSAQDAFLCVVNGLYVTGEAALSLFPGFHFGIAELNLRNSSATIERKCGRRLTRDLVVVIRHAIAASGQLPE
jgi:hypothetical protein